MTFEIEVSGRTRNVEARGAAMFLDGQPVDADVARVGHAWSFIVGPKAGHDENDVTASEVVSGFSRTGRSYEVAVVEHAAGDLTVHVNGRPVTVRWWLSGHGGPQGPARRERGGSRGPAVRARDDQGGEQRDGQRDERGGEQGGQRGGEQRIRAPRAPSGARADVAGHGPQRVVAPMPGRIAKVLVKVGDVVVAGQGLVVVEAMKMENELRSPRAGTVTEVPAGEGALVKANAVLVVVE